jgi:Flp pilus assembly protein TadG
VTIFAIISFSMLLVVIGLIVDVGRVMNVHSQANSFADRAALAAAAELDGRAGALERARQAVFGANAQIDPGFRFTLSDDNVVSVQKVTFMASLGDDPVNPFARSPVTSGPVSQRDVVTATGDANGVTPAAGYTSDRADRETRFILVDVTPETEDYLFFPIVAFLVPDIERSATVAPQAVAGFERQLCNSAPIMVCNPTEPPAGNANASFDTTPGTMIRSRLQAGTLSTSWGPGVYSLLDVADPGSRSALRRYMGSTNPGAACYGNSVIVERNPQRSSNDFQRRRDAINEGLNVRFDMYNGAMYGRRTDAEYAPAPNVTKGLRTDVSDQCENSTSNSTIPLPRTATWVRSTYWSRNHNGASLPSGLSEASTRYQVYRREFTDPVGPPESERSPPTCSNLTPDTNILRDRRVVQVAVVNCRAYRNDLRDGNEVPVVAYADMFLTEPAGNTLRGANADELDIEVIGLINPNLPENKVREFPVLAR